MYVINLYISVASAHAALLFSLVTLDKSVLLFCSDFKINLVAQRLVKLVLRLAFLCFNFEFFVICLLFVVFNLNCLWYCHVSPLAFRKKLQFAISVAPYS